MAGALVRRPLFETPYAGFTTFVLARLVESAIDHFWNRLMSTKVLSGMAYRHKKVFKAIRFSYDCVTSGAIPIVPSLRYAALQQVIFPSTPINECFTWWGAVKGWRQAVALFVGGPLALFVSWCLSKGLHQIIREMRTDFEAFTPKNVMNPLLVIMAKQRMKEMEERGRNK